jgi:hypothetical protein
MTYKEILLGVAEFQRAVLDIHAWINFVEVYQSCLFSGPNGMVKYKANQDLMGAFTEKVQVAQQLLAMGIPVWLICPSFRILPTMNVYIPSPQLHCEKIVLEYFKDGAGNSDPYPVLATGPPSSKLYRCTQNIGCGIMDLQNITAIGRQDFIKGKASIGGVRDECMFSACNDATHLTTPNEDSIPVLPTSALHSDTVFVPEKYIMEMKALVETVRPEKSKGKAKASVLPDEQPAEDSYEPGMKVPVSALEGCLASFIAADERRTKASTQFFADTGLMAMLCHHDHVLSLVNMTSAGEHQYYALVLIKMLFMNLPLSMTVGILYDIAQGIHGKNPFLHLQFSMHMVTSGPANLFITLINVKGLASLMVRVVNISGGLSSY